MTVCSAVSSGFSSALCAAAVEGPDVRSSLNQPLRVRMSVTLRDGEELAANCVRAVHPKRDDLPVAPGARASLLRDERGPYVLYSSSTPVTEPVIRGAVEVGCTDPVTREFVVLLDPPAINAPQAQAAELNQPAAQAPRTPAAPSISTAGAPRLEQPVTRIRPRAAQPPVAAKTPKQTKRANPKRVETTAPLLTDRLTLSAPDASDRGLLGASGGAGTDLKLSDLLTRLPQPSDTPMDPEHARRIVVEQARLAAILRDEDPVAAAMAKERELIERLANTNRDLAAARAQVEGLQTRNRALESFSWLKWVAWGAASLLVLAALFFGLRAIRNAWRRTSVKQEHEDPWWTGMPSTRIRNPVTTAAVENLYLDTIRPLPGHGAPAAALDTPTSTFEAASADSAHKIDVQEFDHGSTTFMREFELSQQTHVEPFSTTIVRPDEGPHAEQSDQFQVTQVDPAGLVLTPPSLPTTESRPHTKPSLALDDMPPLDFDLSLPVLDLDVSSPEEPSATSQDGIVLKPFAKP